MQSVCFNDEIRLPETWRGPASHAWAVADAPLDPLLLGQRIVAILETGQRTATYKLELLIALIEHCSENMPERTDDAVSVPLPALAHRSLRWRIESSPRTGDRSVRSTDTT